MPTSTLNFTDDSHRVLDSDVVRFKGLTAPDEDGVRKEVWCAVSHEALADKGRLKGMDKAELVAVYDRHAPTIHQIAARKYSAGQIESDGLVLVKTEDLNP